MIDLPKEVRRKSSCQIDRCCGEGRMGGAGRRMWAKVALKAFAKDIWQVEFF